MDLSEKVLPFLTDRQKSEPRLQAWVTVLQAHIDQRYGATITGALEPIFASTAADAIIRRIDRPNRLVRGQTAGPASVSYDPRAPLGGWFLPEEIEELDRVTGIGGGARTVRMAAPDGVRFRNLVRTPAELVEED